MKLRGKQIQSAHKDTPDTRTHWRGEGHVKFPLRRLWPAACLELIASSVQVGSLLTGKSAHSLRQDTALANGATFDRQRVGRKIVKACVALALPGRSTNNSNMARKISFASVILASLSGRSRARFRAGRQGNVARTCRRIRD